MPFLINEFRSELIGSGARPNLFQVELAFPNSAPDGEAGRVIRFMAEAASLPGDNLGTISAYYFGRELKYPGDRRFDPWAIRVINDENFTVHTAFTRWMNSLNMHLLNHRSIAASVPRGYQVDAIVRQYAKTGETLKSYNMIGCWPSQISPIELSWESADTLEKFDVTLQYQWWENDVTT